MKPGFISSLLRGSFLVTLMLSAGALGCSDDNDSEPGNNDTELPGDTDSNDTEPPRDAGSNDTEPPSDAGIQDEPEFDMLVTIAGTSEALAINAETSEIVATLPIGKGPAIVIATPDNKKAYTANWGDNSVSSIDTKTLEVVNIPTGKRPYVIAMSPDGAYVYAGLYNDAIAVINTSTDTVERTIDSEIFPASLFVSPDGGTLYVATTDEDPGLIWAISAKTGEITHEKLVIGRAPGWITMSPDGAKVYALNFYTDDVSVVDTATWKVEATISTGEGSKGVIGNVTPDNSKLYVTNLGTSELMAIDTTTHDISQTVPLDGRPSGVHFNQDATHIYVTDYGPESKLTETNSDFLVSGVWSSTHSGYVKIIEAATGTILSNIKVGPGPTSVVGVQR